MQQDPSRLAREYIDGALRTRASLGRSAKPSKASYDRAVRLAREAMKELLSLAPKNEPHH